MTEFSPDGSPLGSGNDNNSLVKKNYKSRHAFRNRRRLRGHSFIMMLYLGNKYWVKEAKRDPSSAAKVFILL